MPHSKNNLTRYRQKYRKVFMWSTRFSCQILMKLEFSWQFQKLLKYQVLSKSVHWKLSCCMRRNGRTDGKTDMKLIVAFRNFANAPKMDNIKYRVVYLRLYIECLIFFFFDFNQTWIFQTDFDKSLHYKISLKSVQCKPIWCMRI